MQCDKVRNILIFIMSSLNKVYIVHIIICVGTMGKEENGEVDPDQGSLYMVNDQNYLNPPIKVKPVSISNGIAWTKNNKFMFFIDTPTRNIDVFDFDIDSGSISEYIMFYS